MDLAEHHVRVNITCPCWIDTEIDDSAEKRTLNEVEHRINFPERTIPLTKAKPGSAARVIGLVLILMSECARHITGPEIWIDGAQSLLQG